MEIENILNFLQNNCSSLRSRRILRDLFKICLHYRFNVIGKLSHFFITAQRDTNRSYKFKGDSTDMWKPGWSENGELALEKEIRRKEQQLSWWKLMTSFLLIFLKVTKTRWVYCHNLSEMANHTGLSDDSKTIFLPPSLPVRCEKFMKAGGRVVSHCIQPQMCKIPK